MRSLALFFSLAAGSSCAAQAVQTYIAQHVAFTQLGPFTQSELENTCGLRSGTHFTTVELSAAVQRLSESGYFDAVSARLNGSTVVFDIKPTDRSHLLLVGFENFVWLTKGEIKAAIQAKLPLYDGLLPEGSPLQDDIQHVIAAALAAKSIQAEVTYQTYEPTLQHPQRTIGFRIVTPSIRVTNIKLSGVTHDLVPLIQRSVNATAHTRYTEGPANETTQESILAPLLNAGYIEANLADVLPVPSSQTPETVGLIINARLEAGEIYKVSTMTYAGSPLLSAEAFNASAKLHPGDVASRAALLASLTPIDTAYRRQGYADVAVKAAPNVNKATHEVAYSVTVEPGEQYRVHEMIATNLDPAARTDFDRGFLMKAGDLYNPEYISGFLKNNTALRALENYSASWKATADPAAHTVDLVITFTHSAH